MSYNKLSIKNPEEVEINNNEERAQIIDLLSMSKRMNMIKRLERGLLEDLDIELRPNQITAIEKLVEFLRTTDETEGYFLQPTGAGKTFLFGLITKLLDTQTTILVPSTTLLKQTKEEFISGLGFSEKEVYIMQSGKPIPPETKIIITTYQGHVSRLKPSHFDKNYSAFLKKSPVVIYDEAHRALGEETVKTYTDTEDASITEEDLNTQIEALSNIDSFTSKGTLRLGFTATPKLSQKEVGSYFGKCIAKETYGNLIKAGILVPFEISQINGACNQGDITSRTTLDEEEAFIEKQEMYKKLLEKWEEKQKSLQIENGQKKPMRTIVFCPTIKGCDDFAKIAQNNGWKCKIVTSREKSENKNILKEAEEMLLKGEIDFIVTVDMLKEGYDCRPINSIILARATTSSAVKIQAAGRGARRQKKKEDEEFGEKNVCHIFEGVFKIQKRTSKEAKSEKGEIKNYRQLNGGGYLKNEGEPYSLADCLAIAGEDIEDLAIGHERIEQKKIIEFSDGGLAIIIFNETPKQIVYLPVYIQNFPYIDEEKIINHKLKPKKILLNKDLARFGEIQVEEVYIKEQIDEIIKDIYSKEVHFNEEGVGTIINTYKTMERKKIVGDEVVDLKTYLVKKLGERYMDKNTYEEFVSYMIRHQTRSIPRPNKEYIDFKGNKIIPDLYDKKELDDFLERLKSRELLAEDNIPSRNDGIIITETGGIDSKIAFSIQIQDKTFEMPLMTSLVNFEKILKELKRDILESDWGMEDLSSLSDRLNDYIHEIYDYHEKGGTGTARFSDQIIERKIEPLIEDIQDIIIKKIGAFEKIQKTGT